MSRHILCDICGRKDAIVTARAKMFLTPFAQPPDKLDICIDCWETIKSMFANRDQGKGYHGQTTSTR